MSPANPRFSIGGQAVLEGVMMRSPAAVATAVRKPDGEGHAVLTVRTDEGDFILDNLSDTVKPWEATGYRYLKRQSTTHTGRWVSVREGNPPMVGSVD